MTRKRLNWGAWKISVQNCITKLEKTADKAGGVFLLLERHDLSPAYKASKCSQLAGQLGTYIRRADHKIELAGNRYAPLQAKLASARDHAQEIADGLSAAARLIGGGDT